VILVGWQQIAASYKRALQVLKFALNDKKITSTRVK